MDSDEGTLLVGRKSQHFLLLLCAICVLSMGDAVEFYLAGILTPSISCDLELSRSQEGVLNVLFYAGYCAGSLLGGVVVRKGGLRRTILWDLATTILVTIVTGFSHSPGLLFVTRVLMGLLVGVNWYLALAYWKQECREPETAQRGVFIYIMAFGFGIMALILYAYLALAAVGWRVFFVSCALPFHVLALVLLAWYQPRDEGLKKKKPERGITEVVEEDEGKGAVFSRPDILVTGLCSCLMFANVAQMFGLITLLPAVYREDNLEAGVNGAHCHIVFGGQFLRLFLIHVVGPIVAQGITYVLLRLYRHSLRLMAGVVGLKLMAMVLLTTLNLGTLPRDGLFAAVKAMTKAEMLLFWIYQTEAIEVDAVRTTSGTVIEGISGLGPLTVTAIVAAVPVAGSLVFMSSVGALEVVSMLLLLIL